MLTLLHGDKTVASRAELQRILVGFRATNTQIEQYSAKDLSLIQLSDMLGGQALFSPKICVVIEGLHALPKSTKKDQLIAEVKKHVEDKDMTIVLWESKLLTPAQAAVFSKGTVLSFKSSSTLFQWLDALSGKPSQHMFELLDKAEQTEGIEYCFVMYVRQIRLLLSMKVGAPVKVAPFLIGKLQAQAGSFSESALLHLHADCVRMDELQKTSGSSLSLRGLIDTSLLSI
jgi:DNA polymerase III delta subunit